MAIASKMGQGGKGASGKKSCVKCNEEYKYIQVYPNKRMVHECKCGRYDKKGNKIS